MGPLRTSRLRWLALVLTALALSGCYQSFAVGEGRGDGGPGPGDPPEPGTPRDGGAPYPGDPLYIADAVTYPIMTVASVIDGEDAQLSYVHNDSLDLCGCSFDAVHLSAGYVDGEGGFWRELDIEIRLTLGTDDPYECYAGKAGGVDAIPCEFDGTIDYDRANGVITVAGFFTMDIPGWDVQLPLYHEGPIPLGFICLC